MKDDADEERQFLGGEWWIVIREWAGELGPGREGLGMAKKKTEELFFIF